MSNVAAEFKYNSDLVGGSLMVRESRIIAGLLLDGASQTQWHQAIQIENQLQKRSPATAKRNAQAIKKRLERLNEDYWRMLRNGDDELATQVSFIAALVRNLLLLEFMETVVADAFLTKVEKLHAYQWQEFLDDRQARDTTIGQWAESSRKKMGQVVFRILAEMGYLASTRSPKLQPVAIRTELKQLLIDEHQHRLLACMELAQ